MTKKMVWEETYAPRLEMSDIKGSPDDIAKLFRDEQLIVANHFGIADPTTIEFKAQHYGYDGGTEMMVRFPRLETDAEYKARLKKEEAAARKQDKAKAKRRVQYEKLKAEFGECK